MSDKVADTLDKGGEFAHGYTYSGHPLSAAVALENLRLMKQENIVAKVAEETAPYLQQRLRQVLAQHPLVGEVRGVGMVAALELVADKASHQRLLPSLG